MNARRFFSRFFHPAIASRAAVTLVALACSSLAFSGEIHEAAVAGDLDKVKALLKDNPDLVSTTDDRGLTPLHMAAWYGRTNVEQLLLAKNADINARDVGGRTPLDLAAWFGGKAATELLLASNADYNIHDAAAIGDIVRVHALLKQNPDLVFSRLNSWTPLHCAAMNGQKDAVQLLLAYKADINTKGTDGWTPLQDAVTGGHTAVVELLLANGVDINAKCNLGMTALDFAAEDNNKAVAKLLVAKKADYTVQDAAALDDLETLKTLLKRYPDLVLTVDAIGRTPLHLAAQNGQNRSAEFLLANKAEINAKDHQGKTPLHYAAEAGRKEFVQLLLANKADITAKDDTGMHRTPLDAAEENGHQDVVEILKAAMDLGEAIKEAGKN